MRDKVRVARLAIHDMLENIEHIRRSTADATFERFAEQRILQMAIERGVQIISEASRRIPDELKGEAPEIPWKKVAGIGNVLRHNYRDVAPRAIWDVIEQDLAPLEAALRKLLAKIGE